MIPFSILDLAPIRQGHDAAEAFRTTRDQAWHAERLAFHCYWLAEHHNIAGIGNSARPSRPYPVRALKSF